MTTKMTNELIPWTFRSPNPMFRVGESAIAGEGLIAKRYIKPETPLFSLTTPFPAGLNPWPYTVAFGMKLNHSLDANTHGYQIPATEPGHVIIQLKSSRKIKPDEEITTNYNDLAKLGFGDASTLLPFTRHTVPISSTQQD